MPELLEKDLSGKVYVITGATSGIGLATARQLLKQNAHVVAACRRPEAGKVVLRSSRDGGTWEVVALDLADLSSVRRCAAAILMRYDRLDGLVNNAAVSSVSYTETKQGIETHFGVNHVGHFLLTELLLDTLKASAPSRIVVLSDAAHAGSPMERPTLHLDDPKWERRVYSAVEAYAQSKLATLIYARALALRLKDTGVTTVSAHPGWTATNLNSNRLKSILLGPLSPFLRLLGTSDGAQTTLHCLLDDKVRHHAGEYFSQSSILYRDPEYRDGGWPTDSPNPNVYDNRLMARIVEESKRLAGL